jgi:hypothetical protein
MLLHELKKKRSVKIESSRSCKPEMQEKKYGCVHTVIAAIGATTAKWAF